MNFFNRVNLATRVMLGKNQIVTPVVKSVGTRAKTSIFDEDLTGANFRRIIPRPNSARGYQSYEELSKTLIDKLPAEETRKLMATNNPAVARVVNDIKKFAISGWTLKPKGHPLFTELWDNMSIKNKKFNNVLGEFAYSLAVDGAMFSEIVIDEHNAPKMIKAIPAYTAEFRYAEDGDGEYPQLGQYDREYDNYFKPLSDDPTISYDVLLPETGNPYGRNIIDPGLYHLNMVRGFFQSFKQAIASIIWPNLLINIDREQLQNMSVEEQNAVVQALVLEVKKEIEKLEPGGVLIYGSEVKVGDFISGMNRTNLGAVMDCVDIMDREIIRALETEPVLFGRNEGLAESHVDTQMINYGYFIRDIQGIINETLTGYFNYLFYLNNVKEVAEFKLDFSLFEEYLKKIEVYLREKEALKAGSEDLKSLVDAIGSAKEQNLMDDTEAKQYFDEQLAIRESRDVFNRPT